MAGANSGSPSPTNKPDQKSMPLILTTITTTTSSSPFNQRCEYAASVRKLLVDARQEVDKCKPESDRTVLLFTGGWIPDVLLATRSVEIGIESNPQVSRRLEAATTKILALDIDFVSIESWGYSESSRIQYMQLGIAKRILSTVTPPTATS
ncbi:hypothetical protein B9Z19DRAFT_1135183 [Tuber borchii]|uniref:Uncharacterized protein n=1 Tax=Tuber borchii TaxID=42251 RepID=A0A2T6ZD41_TUBBO|nr:hypothetical protein B9Z19DRAFT_1135183 [Tuber borchii]